MINHLTFMTLRLLPIFSFVLIANLEAVDAGKSQ